jgi:hypothetical protein
MHKTARWYDRERLPYAVDRKTAEEYAIWLRQVPWKLFCTLTFAWKVSDPQADKTFTEFINRLERTLGCDVGYVRGDEKRFSGCGKPACGRHFHVLMTSAAPISPSTVACLWQGMAGNRSDKAGAHIEPYDASQNGVSYVLKFINQVDGDWKFGRLDLFHPEVRRLRTPTKRLRRHLRRHEARELHFSQFNPMGSELQLSLDRAISLCNPIATDCERSEPER